MVPSKDLRRESKSCRAGTRKHGEVRRVYSTLGMVRTLRKRQKASWARKTVACSPGSEVTLFSSTACDGAVLGTQYNILDIHMIFVVVYLYTYKYV